MSLLTLIFPLVLVPSSVSAQDDDRAFLENASKSIVTVDAVLNLELSMMGQVQNEESRVSFRGLVVSSNGLILVSTDAINPNAANLGPLAAQGISMKASTQEIKVVIENEEKEYTGRLVAEDSKYRVSYIAITDLEDRELETVTWDNESRPDIGDKVRSVSRMSKGYDYAPYLIHGSITGKIKKPRRALMSDAAIEAGAAVFGAGKGAIGVLTTVNSDLEMAPSFLDMISPTPASNLFILSAKAMQTSIASAIEEMKKPVDDAKEAGDSGDGSP